MFGRANAAGLTGLGFAVAVRSDGGVTAVGAYVEASYNGSVYVYRDERLATGGVGVTLGAGDEVGIVEVVGQGKAGVDARVADSGRLYRMVPWSPWGGSSAWFGSSVVFVGGAGSEVLLVGAAWDSTCGDMKSGDNGVYNPLCSQSGAVYVLGPNTSASGAGEYARAGIMKAPNSSVIGSAWFGIQKNLNDLLNALLHCRICGSISLTPLIFTILLMFENGFTVI